MTKKSSREIKNKKVLPQQTPPVSLDLGALKASGGKPGRPQAEPRIQSRIRGGRTYYVYRRGAEKETHLGTADFILEAVREKRRPKK